MSREPPRLRRQHSLRRFGQIFLTNSLPLLCEVAASGASLNASGSSPVAEGSFPWRCAVSNFLNAIRARRRPASLCRSHRACSAHEAPRDRVAGSRPRLRFPPTRHKESQSTRKHVSVSRNTRAIARRRIRRDTYRPDRRNGSRRFRPPWPATNQPAPTGRADGRCGRSVQPVRERESLTSD